METKSRNGTERWFIMETERGRSPKMFITSKKSWAGGQRGSQDPIFPIMGGGWSLGLLTFFW